MRVILIFLLVLIWLANAHAHPGIGIVRDSQGNIYYTDLIHVWRITPEGQKSIVVREVHTHELSIDAEDNLYGEDLRYSGEATNRWTNRIWKRSRTGIIMDVVPVQEGHRNNYGFAQDRFGNQYWIYHEPSQTFVRRRTMGGSLATLKPDRELGILNWVAVSPDGKSLYLCSNREVFTMTQNGHVETLLADDNRGRHTVMGLAPQPDGSVYMADFGQQAVKKISKAGQVTIVAAIPDPWSPSGVCLAPDGTLWILEYSDRNEARVRSIMPGGRVRIY